jgi:hypothetical protein
MVDEVEISNVGGPKGVASEATLAALVSALNKGDTNRDRGLRLEDLARASNTREIKTSTKEQGILGKAIVGTAGAAVGLGKEFLFGGNRLGDFSKAVFGADSAITSLVRYTDSLIDTYRELSSVGAGFNNSLFDFIKTSAMTGMSLGDFSDLVSQNSTRLRMLGGTVTEGAKRFGQISKTLRQDFGIGLSRVGFTMTDLNDVLLEYSDFSISQVGRETRSNRQLAAAAASYGMELDQLSKLTGISRKQLAETITQQQADQRVRLATIAMDEDQRKRFNQTLAVAGSASPELKEALIDLADGIPDDEITKKLITSSDAFAALGGDIENMSTQEMMKFFASVGKDIDMFSNRPGFQQLIKNDGAFASIASMGAGLRSYSDLTQEQIDRMVKEQNARDTITETLVAFENALNNVKTFLMDELFGENAPFGKSLKAFGESITKLVNSLFGESGTGGTAGGLTSGFQGIIDSLFGENGILTLLVKDFTTFTNELALSDDPMGLFKTKVGELGTSIKNWFMDMLLGTKVEIGTRGRPGEVRIERQGGLLQSISDGFSSLFKEGSILTTIKDSIASAFSAAVEGISNFWNDPANQAVINEFFTGMKDMFSRLVDLISNLMREKFGGIAGSELGSETMKSYEERLRGQGEPLTSEEREDLLNTLKSQDRTRIIEEKGSGFLGWRNAANFLGEASGFASDAFNLNQLTYDDEDLLELIDANKSPDRRSIGTLGATGLKFEPKDTVAQLHKGERVLSPEETAKYNSTSTQSISNEKLDQLNNTMMRVAGLLDSALGVQTRTMKNVKSLGFDYYRGSPA